MLQDTLRADLKKAMLAKDELRRNIIRLVLGEVDMAIARNQPVNDEKIHGIIRKIQVANNETLAAGGNPILADENRILSEYLPQYWTVDQIRDSLSEEVKQQIVAAKSDGQATGVAMKSLKAANAIVQGSDVAAVVNALRG